MTSVSPESSSTSSKLRMVLDYVPCDACLTVHDPDQDLLCSVCNRLDRKVATKTILRKQVIVETPLPPPPPEIVEIAPAQAITPEPEPESPAQTPEEAREAPEAPDELPAQAEVASQDASPEVGEADDEDDLDVGFGVASDDEVGFGVAGSDGAEEETADDEIGFDFTSSPAPDFVDEETELERVHEETPASAAAESEFTFKPLPRDTQTVTEAAETFTRSGFEEQDFLQDEGARPEVPPAGSTWDVDGLTEGRPVPEVEPEAESAPEPMPEPAPDADSLPEEEEILEMEVIEDAPPAQAQVAEEVAAVEEAAPQAVEAEAMVEEEILDMEIVEEVPAPAEETVPAAVPTPPADPSGGRESPPVTVLDGLGTMYADRLKNARIHTVSDFVGRDVHDVADQSGVSAKLLERWIATAELMTVAGVPQAYADAFVRAGLRTIGAFAARDPAELAAQVNKFLGGKGQPPKLSISDIEAWQARAR